MAASHAIAVAYSGGRDSTALLHATLHAAREAGLEVHALHVHHGLGAHADGWLAHCEAQCRRWARAGWPVHFHATRLALRPARGESLEAVARTARYAALRCMALAAGADLVLLAHHRRDQAETLLLQALRGAGVAGLAGMPGRVEREGLSWARPWLAQSHEAIAAYVRRHRLSHIVDDSNADPRHARNRLRLQVWPALQAAFPQAETTLADAATLAQQARACVADLAAIDLAACTDEDGLDLASWRGLAPHRAAEVLRAWLRGLGHAATAHEIERLLRELPRDGPARWPLGRGELRRYRNRAHWTVVAAAPEAVRETSLVLKRAGRHALPGWGGVLVARRVREAGIAVSRLVAVEVVARSGGERFQPDPGRPARSLKKQYQAAGLPAWAREGPLLYCDGRLAFVPGLGIDARLRAAPGEPQFALTWEPAAAG